MIHLHDLKKSYPQGTRRIDVLDGVSLDVAQGEFITVFGPNGCGKSTLLRIVAGLETADAGTVAMDASLSLGFVFQDYASSLFPWKSVAENLAVPLKIRGLEKSRARSIVNEQLRIFGLVEHKDKYPYQLSGGLRQLTAIARAWAQDPNVVLFDEPFSALDYSRSRYMWNVVRSQSASHKNVSSIFVSHSVDEALFLGDRLVVLSPRPARVVEIFTFGLDRSDPRCLTSADFAKARNDVLLCFAEAMVP